MTENIVYGLFNLRQERELAQSSHGYILRDIYDIKTNYIRLGFHLNECLTMKYFEDFGFDNFYNYCEVNFKLDKSSVSRIINVWKEFCLYDDPFCPKMFIDPKWADFSFSQLVEMLPMKDDMRLKCKPDMTVKQLRDLKHSSVATSQQSFQVPKKDNNITNGNFREIKEPDKIATSQLEIVNQDCDLQPELPLLKNNDQRKDWLSRYKDWGLWYHDDYIDVNYYKFDFGDGSRLVAAEFPHRRNHWNNGYSDQVYFHLLEKNYKGYKSTYDKQYVHAPDSETYIIDFLKDLQKKK